MLRLLSVSSALALALSVASVGQASAASCKDASGKFAKCPVPAAAAKPVHCKDASGKFTKCAVSAAAKPAAKPMAAAKPATAAKPAAKKS
jgi:hypothetical protein